MRIRVTIDLAALPRAGAVQRSVEVLLEARADTRFAEVRGPLARAAGLGDVEDTLTFIVGGKAVPPTSVVGEAPLLEGALIHVTSYAAGPAPAPTVPSVVPGLLELHVVSGQGAGRRFPLGRGVHSIGRARSCAIRLDDRGVSRVHAQLDISADGATVSDVEPSNPSCVDGEALRGGTAALELGASLRLGSTTLVLRRAAVPRAQTTTADGMVAVHRPPRYGRGTPAPSIVFPDEPRKPEARGMPLLASLAPVALAGGLAAATSQPIMLLFALMSPVMLLAQWLGDRRQGRVSYRKERARHAMAVGRLREEVAGALRAEADRRRAEQPDLAFLGTLATGPAARLWERRPGDADHAVVRVGLGARPATLKLTGAVPDDLTAVRVLDVPVLVDLARIGVLGIAGPRARVLAQAASLVLQLACWHSPRDLRIVVVTNSPTPEADWGWVSRLPHAAPMVRDRRIASVVSGDRAEAASLLAELGALAASRADQRVPATGPSAPSMVVLLDGAHDLRQLSGVAELLDAGPAAGIRWICLDEVCERLPAETTAQIELEGGCAPRALVRTPDDVTEGVVPDLPARSWVEHLARSLAPLRDATPTDEQRELPARIGLRELHARSPRPLDPTRPEELVQNWRSADRPRTALLGWSATGPFEVDLRTDGPHALVGGTTGAGKSELLQTLIAGLAVAHHPEELSLVLVDYKGGAAFRDCARLPHTVGVVTDLDEHLAARALTSLTAELKRRERILRQHDAKDVDDYLDQRPEGEPTLARLVIVVDEFKMLADELPEFIDGLVRLAAVGRSLGVHLVLATQRPGGIVSGDMRANIALRIALRVRDRTDSMDVVECADAAEISDRCPGRALVRTASLDLAEVQTAYAGGPLAPATSDERMEPTAWPLTWSDLGAPPPRRTSDSGGSGTRTELAALVEAAQLAADSIGAERDTPPWLPPLPERLPIGRLDSTRLPRLCVALGLADRPTLQRQDLLAWDLQAGGHLGLIGGSRTGRTATLRLLALSLAEKLSPSDVHIHVLEGSPGRLRHLEALPQVGTVVGVDDPARAGRLVTRLLAEAMARRSEGSPAGPRIVVLVDGWEPIEDAFDTMNHGAPTEDLFRLLRDGSSAGISVAVTGGRALTSGRLGPLLQQRLVLPMTDPLDLTLAGVSPDEVRMGLGPGRAIDPRDGCQVQLAHAGSSPEPEDQDHAVAMAATVLALEYAALPLEVRPWRILPLPDRIRLADLSPTRGGTASGSVAIGLGGDTQETLGFAPDLQRRVLVAGPARSGRSTALTVLAHQLSRQGRTVALLEARPKAPSQPHGIRGVHRLGAAETAAFIALRRDVPGLAVLVDDADALDGSPIADALLETARLVDAAGGFIALALDLHRATGLYRGLVPEVAVHATGLLLGARSPADGELFRTRVEPLSDRRPGRGFHIGEGVATPIQVAAP